MSKWFLCLFLFLLLFNFKLNSFLLFGGVVLYLNWVFFILFVLNCIFRLFWPLLISGGGGEKVRFD